MAKLINKSIHVKVLKVIDFDEEFKIKEKTSLNELFSLVSDLTLSRLTALTILGGRRKSFQNPLDLSKIASVCTELRSLSVLKVNNGMNEHTLIQIIQNNKHLQRLTVRGCDCKTTLMRAIIEYCAELESLVICEFHSNGGSVESVREMFKSCKPLINCKLNDGFSVSKLNAMVTLRIENQEFLPVCSVIFELHKDKLMTIQLCSRIEENLLMQISEGCPQLTELCIFERWYSWSVAALRSIITRCTLLRKLQLSYVDATHDEMMGIFCSGRVLVLETLNVMTTTPHNALAGCIAEKNRSIVYCRTVEM
jgi:hypothetical protein